MADSGTGSPAPPADRLTRGLVDGCRAGVDGFFFMCRHPSLWAYGIWPVILNVLVAIAVWLGAFLLGQWLLGWATEGLGDGLWAQIKW
ncbi:MAG: hypothetical protein H8E37_12065, partial [Planctomycetes bacterium]|nr:hypothetical protein [Planctomycetota bacterium]